LGGKAHYFLGHEPQRWHTQVPTYAKVHYTEIYPGVDLLYYGTPQQVEYDLVVAAGADPTQIRLGFAGADQVAVDAQGDLCLEVAGRPLRVRKPWVYQEGGGGRQEIASRYVLTGKQRVGFAVGAYDASKPLVIDPVVVVYSTYLGGRGGDIGYGIAVDSAGHAYVTGETYSPDFPTTLGAFQTAHGGGVSGDAFEGV
jgi:hypothetical protein